MIGSRHTTQSLRRPTASTTSVNPGDVAPLRTRARAVAGFAIALLLAPAIAGAAKEPPLVLQPSSPWNMHYADESCQLIRTFGEGDHKVSLELHDFGPGEEFTLIAVGKPLKYSGHAVPLVTRFGPGGKPWTDFAELFGTMSDGEGVLETYTPLNPEYSDMITGGAPQAAWTPDKERKPVRYDSEAEAKITQLQLSGPLFRDLLMELGPLDKPMDAVRICLDSLVRHWGVDVSAHRSLSRRAAPMNFPGEWAKPTDYPPELLRQRKSGVVHFRISVDQQGKGSACVVQTPTNTEFDKLTCQLILQRARFTPALDANRQPIASFYTNSVKWVVP